MTYTIHQQYRRMLGFAHPDLMRLMKYEGVTLFVDGTFKVTPRPFKQTLIWIQVQCNQQWAPSAVLCNFEAALQQGVRGYFPSAFIVGCLFHWEQALRRKTISLGIPADQISLAMKPGSLDTLTLVPEDLILCKAVPYVVKRLYAKLDIRGVKTKWDKFWTYFKNTWTILYKSSFWNISAMVEAHASLVNRTNNPLEAYNRVLATRFGTTHPPLLSFINEITVESV
uniref:MULE transposase domain-containing protein n=1 Tax=Phytophthora ramorum TaxID=164328 RepID=H3H7V2_PHYRM